MKSILLFLLLLVVASSIEAQRNDSLLGYALKNLYREPPAPVRQSRALVQVQWINQTLDHFNSRDERTWEMRYMVNDEFFKENGPLFIFVGGEWTISSEYITGGHMYDMAKEHSGMLVYTEHRYYGQSRPTDDLTRENLEYLNVRQALEDLAHFIRTFKAETTGLETAKVILVGGSYSATMVTWFKQLYPSMVAGCWASSAPLLAKLDFVEYREITGESIKIVGGGTCYSRINNAVNELEAMFANKRGAEIKAMLKLCDNFDETNDLDLWTLFRVIADIFGIVVQTHDDGQIQWVCNDVMSGRTDVIGLLNFMLRFGNPEGCNDVTYRALLEEYMYTRYSPNRNARQWYYQTCNEYGWYQSSNSKEQPFGTKVPLTLFTTLCRDIFGDQYTDSFIQQQVDETNNYFGALDPKVQNVYMSHGQLDPWSSMGIQEGELVTNIPLYAHCKDFESISSNDSAEMRASKEKIAQLVREWLAA